MAETQSKTEGDLRAGRRPHPGAQRADHRVVETGRWSDARRLREDAPEL